MDLIGAVVFGGKAFLKFAEFFYFQSCLKGLIFGNLGLYGLVICFCQISCFIYNPIFLLSALSVKERTSCPIRRVPDTSLLFSKVEQAGKRKRNRMIILCIVVPYLVFKISRKLLKLKKMWWRACGMMRNFS